MKSINGILHLEVDELVAAGLSRHSVYSARKRGTKGYTFVPDPEDARRVLLKYDDLQPAVKAMVNEVHGDAVAGKRTGLWSVNVQPAAADLETLRNHVLADGSRLPEEVVAKYAVACAYLRVLHTTTKAQVKAWGYATISAWMQDVLAKVQADKVELPTSYGRLMSKVRQWAKEGACATISAKWGNDNSRKIGAAQSAYLIAEYAQPNKPDTSKVTVRYNLEAQRKGWPALTESAVYKHLMRPEVEPIWTMGRHGKDEWKKDYSHLMKLRGPSFRDAMWCGDGTKLNYFYQGENGMMAKLQHYIIIDVFSEAIIGHSFGERENFSAQYRAAKMALKTSGHKPSQWLYDGQGGHVKKEAQEFYDRATKLHFPAMPNNAQSKPIENLLGRVQQQVMRDRWFFTGMNVQSKTLNSKPNMEFIMAHKDKLPTREEAIHYGKEDIAKWNSMPHPKTGVPRLAMYQQSMNPQAQPISFIDMVELFWVTSAKPVKYSNSGLTITIQDQRLMYEVYAPNGLPCADFLRQWTKASFYCKYDPEDLSAMRLYRERPDGTLSYVAQADAKRAYARAVVDLQPGERSEIDNLLALRKAQEAHARKELEEVRNISGIDPETLVAIGYRGADKDAMNRAEAELQTGNAHHHHQEEDDEIDLVDRL